ncbi:hypothetical protein Ms3S1_19100 [Methylosinus sp. 3S-1]
MGGGEREQRSPRITSRLTPKIASICPDIALWSNKGPSIRGELSQHGDSIGAVEGLPLSGVTPGPRRSSPAPGPTPTNGADSARAAQGKSGFALYIDTKPFDNLEAKLYAAKSSGFGRGVIMTVIVISE